MHDEAIAELKKATQLNPKSEKAHSILFTFYDKLGRTEEAIEEDRVLKQIASERSQR